MSDEKPVRIYGDPEGYEPVFDGTEERCQACAFYYDLTISCFEMSCHQHKRPENKSVRYVKTELANGSN